MEASTPMVTFGSGGQILPGLLHLPQGPGPHPVVVLLQGFPGHERNTDIAQAMRRAGYAALVFHYRGAWGTGGDWSWGNTFDDAARVVAAVRQPEFAAQHRLDPTRVALFGHSLGGFVALRTAAADPAVAAVVSVAGFDFGTVAEKCRVDPAVRARYVADFDAELLPLRGTSGAALVAEMDPAWRLADLAPHLADRAVLLIGTARDPVTPAEEHHQPLAAAYAALPRLEQRVYATDHALSDHRLELADAVLDFLGRHVPVTPTSTPTSTP